MVAVQILLFFDNTSSISTSLQSLKIASLVNNVVRCMPLVFHRTIGAARQ
jgi:hypothetical protein